MRRWTLVLMGIEQRFLCSSVGRGGIHYWPTGLEHVWDPTKTGGLKVTLSMKGYWWFSLYYICHILFPPAETRDNGNGLFEMTTIQATLCLCDVLSLLKANKYQRNPDS